MESSRRNEMFKFITSTSDQRCGTYSRFITFGLIPFDLMMAYLGMQIDNPPQVFDWRNSTVSPEARLFIRLFVKKLIAEMMGIAVDLYELSPELNSSIPNNNIIEIGNNPDPLINFDGHYTCDTNPSIALSGHAADCPLIAIINIKTGARVVVHAGVSGLSNLILEQAVDWHFNNGSNPQDLMVHISPHAKTMVYPNSSQLLKRNTFLKDSLFTVGRDDQGHLDNTIIEMRAEERVVLPLTVAIYAILESRKIQRAQILVPDNYNSHRNPEWASLRRHRLEYPSGKFIPQPVYANMASVLVSIVK